MQPVWVIGILLSLFVAVFLPAVVWLLVRRRCRRYLSPVTPGSLVTSAVGYTVFAVGFMAVILPACVISLTTCGQCQWFHGIIRFSCRVYTHLIPGVEFEFRGVDNLPDEPHVLVCNHQSVLDLVALMSVSSRHLFLVNESVWNNRLLKLIVRPAGFIPTGIGIAGTCGRFGVIAGQGRSLAVFPEGTRSSDDKVHRYRSGAFVLATQAGVPVVPAVISGASRVLSKHDPLAHPGRIILSILPPVMPAGDDYAALRRKVHMMTCDEFERLSHRVDIIV